ncbi:MAG: BrnT family toxin [Anaerolineae bacterium]|nr:BrnT family toxin [Anaerolineae bacterium]
MQYNFEWDTAKAKKNLRDHKVSFERASQVFADPFMLSIGDEVMNMKEEYDFSGGVRGRFYRPNVHLNLPVYLDDDIAEFVQKYAQQKKVDVQTVVNRILRSNKEMLQALQ